MASSPRRSALIRASAEFVVIVVGVLVALAVDSWAGERGERLAQIRYLKGLAGDVRQDSVLLTDLLVPGVVRAESTVLRIAPVVRREVPFPEDTVALFEQVLGSLAGFSMLGGRSTFDELLATGSLGLIESPDLRASIVSFYGSKTLTERRAATRESGYAGLVHSHFPNPPTGLTYIRGAGNATESAFRAFGMGQAAEAIQTPEFGEALNRWYNYLLLVRPMLEGVLDETNSLLPRIEAELDRIR